MPSLMISYEGKGGLFFKGFKNIKNKSQNNDISTIDTPPGVPGPGCQKIRKSKLKIPLVSLSAKVQPNLKRIGYTLNKKTGFLLTIFVQF